MAEDLPVENITKKFLQTSRYKHTNIYEGPDDSFYYGVWKVPTIEENPLDTFYTVKFSETRRLDKIADLHYGNINLWWIIALANNILDPFSELTVGDIIRVPNLAYIISKILP